MMGHTVSSVIEGRAFVTAAADTTVRRVAELMKGHRIGAVLITDPGSGVLQGICTERDIVFGVVAAGLDPEAMRVESVMTRSPQTTSPDCAFGHALHLMFEGGFHHVPVVQDGRPVGILCAKDALGYDALQFETELIRREEITVIL